MSMTNRQKRSRTGFTLPEMLVAVAMVGVLSAVVLPTVIGQVAKGETSRVVSDLQSVESASQMFRKDIGKWPSSLTHLVTAPASNVASLDATNYPSNVADVWDGPYLARGNVPASGLPTSGGTIELALRSLQWDGSPATEFFVVIAAEGLNSERRALIEAAVDGTDGTDPGDAAHGKIRVDGGNDLLYYTSPLK